MIKHKSSITIFRNNSPSFPKCVMAYSLLHFFIWTRKTRLMAKSVRMTRCLLLKFCIYFVYPYDKDGVCESCKCSWLRFFKVIYANIPANSIYLRAECWVFSWPCIYIVNSFWKSCFQQLHLILLFREDLCTILFQKFRRLSYFEI